MHAEHEVFAAALAGEALGIRLSGRVPAAADAHQRPPSRHGMEEARDGYGAVQLHFGA